MKSSIIEVIFHQEVKEEAVACAVVSNVVVGEAVSFTVSMILLAGQEALEVIDATQAMQLTIHFTETSLEAETRKVKVDLHRRFIVRRKKAVNNEAGVIEDK